MCDQHIYTTLYAEKTLRLTSVTLMAVIIFLFLVANVFENADNLSSALKIICYDWRIN